MNLLFIYSGKCKHSQKLMNYSVFNKINKINIDYRKNLQHVPHYIESVPVLIIKNNNNINILKNKNLLDWFINNSNKGSNKVNKQPSNNDNNVLEANILDSNFSSNYTFLEGDNNNILENNYSNLNSNNNLGGNLDNNINIDTQSQKKDDNSLSKAYEDLLKSRDDYKNIERV